MKTILTLITAALLTASALARTIVYEVGLFDQLSQFGNIDIVYTTNPDSIGLASYEAVPGKDFSEAIEVTNNKGKLSIKEVPNHNLGEIPTIRVYSSSLNQIKSEGLASITAHLTVATPTFSASLVGNGRIICDNVNTTDVSASITTGNGTIVLRGKCTNASFKLTGTGTIQADELTARNIKCTAFGTGTIGCNATNTLDLRAIGSTKVYYKGKPEIKKIGNPKLYPMNNGGESTSYERSSINVTEGAEIEDDSEIIKQESTVIEDVSYSELEINTIEANEEEIEEAPDYEEE